MDMAGESSSHEKHCTICKKDFSNTSNYRKHMNNIHNINIPSTRSDLSREFMCSTCGARYQHSKHLLASPFFYIIVMIYIDLYDMIYMIYMI